LWSIKHHWSNPETLRKEFVKWEKNFIPIFQKVYYNLTECRQKVTWKEEAKNAFSWFKKNSKSISDKRNEFSEEKRRNVEKQEQKEVMPDRIDVEICKDW
jgi:hypothetical protein